MAVRTISYSPHFRIEIEPFGSLLRFFVRAVSQQASGGSFRVLVRGEFERKEELEELKIEFSPDWLHDPNDPAVSTTSDPWFESLIAESTRAGVEEGKVQCRGLLRFTEVDYVHDNDLFRQDIESTCGPLAGSCICFSRMHRTI